MSHRICLERICRFAPCINLTITYTYRGIVVRIDSLPQIFSIVSACMRSDNRRQKEREGERENSALSMHVHAERFMVTVGTFRVKGSMSQDVSVSEESPKKEKKKKKGLRTPSFLKKKKEKKKSVEA